MKEAGKLHVNSLPKDMRRLDSYYAQMISMPQAAASFNELAILGSFNFLLNHQNNDKGRKSLIVNVPEVPYEMGKERYDIIAQESLRYILGPYAYECLLKKTPRQSIF